MSATPLLVELFTEELPPKVLKNLGNSFATGIFDGLKKRSLLAESSVATMFASPRRLAVHITNVGKVGPDETVVRKLMPSAVGLDADGEPTQALIKKLAGLGRLDFDVSTLEREGEGKAQQLLLSELVKGQSLQVALQAALEQTIEALPVPKVMSYQLADGATTVQFVRPVHGLVALHGANVVPLHILGQDAGAITHGHRFQGAADIELKHADEYESRLDNEGGVIASFEKRRAEIMRQLFAHAEQTGDTLGDAANYMPLLDEVTGLVERPTVYVGKFDAEFLEIPAECLVLTMKLNQKYFPLFLSEGGLSSNFLIVSNMRLDNPQSIIEGNQRVIRPRLSDAKFFFDQDRKIRLEDRRAKLANVVYHNLLGSLDQRSTRIASLAHYLHTHEYPNAQSAERAANLCKCDLVTDMVGEFPELQGVMGKYYAKDWESSEVASAIEEHYKPRFSGDNLPTGEVAEVVAIADKTDSLAALFLAGEIPTGDKDPFALRRAALGLVRILVERRRAVNLWSLVDASLDKVRAHVQFSLSFEQPAVSEVRKRQNFNESPKGRLLTKLEDETVLIVLREQILAFAYDRLRGYLRDLGHATNLVEAVVAQQPKTIGDVIDRLEAVAKFVQLPEAASLAAANKRIGNILKKAERNFADADCNWLVEPAERELFETMQLARQSFDKFYAVNDFTTALTCLAPLKIPVDAFFDSVMVNVDDAKLRENRLALLGDLHSLMNKVADLSKLAT